MAESEKTHRVVIVGAGYTGTEVTAQGQLLTAWLAGRMPGLAGQPIRWMLLDTAPRLLPDLDPRLSKTADRVLRRHGVEVRSGHARAAGSYRVGASTLGRESWRQGEAAAKGRARPLAASERMSPPASIERAIQVGSQRGLHGPQSASFDGRGGRHARCHRQ